MSNDGGRSGRFYVLRRMLRNIVWRLHRPRLGFRDTAVGHVNDEPHGRRASYNNTQ